MRYPGIFLIFVLLCTSCHNVTIRIIYETQNENEHWDSQTYNIEKIEGLIKAYPMEKFTKKLSAKEVKAILLATTPWPLGEDEATYKLIPQFGLLQEENFDETKQ